MSKLNVNSFNAPIKCSLSTIQNLFAFSVLSLQMHLQACPSPETTLLSRVVQIMWDE